MGPAGMRGEGERGGVGMRDEGSRRGSRNGTPCYGEQHGRAGAQEV